MQTEHRVTANTQTKPIKLIWAASPPINGSYHPHPPSPFVIITQPESRYSSDRRTEGIEGYRRLSRPRTGRRSASRGSVCGSAC